MSCPVLSKKSDRFVEGRDEHVWQREDDVKVWARQQLPQLGLDPLLAHAGKPQGRCAATKPRANMTRHDAI